MLYITYTGTNSTHSTKNQPSYNNYNNNNNNSRKNTPRQRSIKSKLLMVDLAGSERVSRTVSSGQRLTEAKMINSSLSALGLYVYLSVDVARHC